MKTRGDIHVQMTSFSNNKLWLKTKGNRSWIRRRLPQKIGVKTLLPTFQRDNVLRNVRWLRWKQIAPGLSIDKTNIANGLPIS
ncbi:hypothetical protein CW304_23790 [Bacillus sp. UFRGS-B20]|nr:hypothetical protein CW304_23790 [Bacillus sp. UFRGS-B20]